MKKYCVSCGTPHEYSITPPSFCGSCGTPFGQVNVAAKQSTQSQPTTKISQTERVLQKLGVPIEEDDGVEIPVIAKLDLKITNSPKVTLTENGLSGGGVMMGGVREPGDMTSIDKVKAKFEDMHRRDAGSEVVGG